MKKQFVFLFALLFLMACNPRETNFTLSGQVKGLKKGTLFLQKMDDTLVTNIDSVAINGDAHYTLQAYLKEPEMLFLYLDKNRGDKNDDIVDFFAEKGKMTLNTSLKNFVLDAKITGSKNQKKLEAYKKMMKRFEGSNLDLIKENFDAQKADDQDKILETQKKYDNLLKRKYLYTINYAINNKNMEIAPYLAISEIYDANLKYLDTIYTSLDKKIKKSKYGKALKKEIKSRKKLEKLDKKVKGK